MSTTLLSRCEDLPVFPLPRVVFLPGGWLPLHVFEPRYRALVAHCLKGDGLLGMATLAPGFEADYHGHPPIHEEIGVGQIVKHQLLGDGRSNILLEYLGSARVVAEIPGPELFRRFRCRFVAEPEMSASGGAAAVEVRAVLAKAGPGLGIDDLNRWLGESDAVLSNALARSLLEDTDRARLYLASDLPGRMRIVSEALVEKMVQGGGTAEA